MARSLGATKRRGPEIGQKHAEAPRLDLAIHEMPDGDHADPEAREHGGPQALGAVDGEAPLHRHGNRAVAPGEGPVRAGGEARIEDAGVLAQILGCARFAVPFQLFRRGDDDAARGADAPQLLGLVLVSLGLLVAMGVLRRG